MQQGLILETSTEKSGVASIQNGLVKTASYYSGGHGLSNRLFTFLQDHPINFAFIGVGIGPGSYTGVRVALTIAKTISYALKIPLIPFSSLYAFILEDKGSFLSMIDAKIGGVYIAEGQNDGQNVHFQSPALYTIEEAESLIRKTPKILSPHPEALKKRFSESTSMQWILSKPNLGELAKGCQKKFMANNFVSPNKIHPIYLREA